MIFIIFIIFNSQNGIIDNIAFKLFVTHFGIGRGIRQKRIPQKKWLCHKYNKLIVSLESPYRPEMHLFFLKCNVVYFDRSRRFNFLQVYKLRRFHILWNLKSFLSGFSLDYFKIYNKHLKPDNHHQLEKLSTCYLIKE